MTDVVVDRVTARALSVALGSGPEDAVAVAEILAAAEGDPMALDYACGRIMRVTRDARTRHRALGLIGLARVAWSDHPGALTTSDRRVAR